MTEAYYIKKTLMEHDWDVHSIENIALKIEINEVIDSTKEYKVKINYCPNCRHKIKINEKECPYCGFEI